MSSCNLWINYQKKNFIQEDDCKKDVILFPNHLLFSSCPAEGAVQA